MVYRGLVILRYIGVGIWAWVLGLGVLSRLMREGGLYCVFQPLADLREGQVYAHEALIRGPQNTPLHTPDKPLELARSEGILQDFELLCVFTALEQWGRHDAPGRLFVNISADALMGAIRHCELDGLISLASQLGISPRMLVLEITEYERVADMDRLAHVPYTHLRAHETLRYLVCRHLLEKKKRIL
mgnify:CR=1 FL=1